jgi:chlorite dismutase
MSAIPPATLEGWYALHQIFALNWPGLRAADAMERNTLATAARQLMEELAPAEGWSAAFRVAAGDGADLLLVHFRPTLDEVAAVQTRVKASALGAYLTPVYDYLSVTEAGLYHATAEAAREHGVGTAEFRAAIEAAQAAELATPHIRSRLYPELPEGMRYLSFYPMTKRRTGAENWYTLDVAERSRLMRDHGMTGRRYAGRIFQVISGSVGFDEWEWGVSLFARDPLEFKRIVTEMRYDEASALYGEFGRFFTGIRLAPEEWEGVLGGVAS